MQYCFEIMCPNDIESEECEMAVNCAAESIESILADYNVAVVVSQQRLYISSADNISLSITLRQCATLVRYAFLDARNRPYPVFGQIRYFCIAPHNNRLHSDNFSAVLQLQNCA